MPFVNERISSEDFNKYDIERIIKNIEGINAPATTIEDILGWTIDRSKNIFLLYVTAYGQFEDRHVETYVLWWDGAVIKADLETVDGSRSDRNSTHMILELPKLILPNGFSTGRAQVLDVLKEARVCRGSRGVFGQEKNYTIEFRF
ncbi:hypothetical protein [Variovorax rhizosphaerae]|uniref:Uncharacterized protein n=1 Tax=Variovorax rhizosphaerae TaxID=1836200 RepID=A0ABU8WQ71_9BURK